MYNFYKDGLDIYFYPMNYLKNYEHTIDIFIT